MLKQNSELRAQAREALRGKWPMAAVAALIYSAIAGGLSSIPFIGWIGSLLVGLPVAYGFAILMLAVFRGAEEVDLGVLFAGFQEYSRILTTKLLQAVYTFLWSLLLLIPGIIKHYSYAMTDYILKDEPELCNNAAIERSMAMMEGNKMKLFLLDLSFIGWGVLFAGFQEYSRILTTKLLQAVYTFLWSLLLLIPGIIKHYSYAMTDYILKDEPELCNNAAIERSMAMMEGNKMKLFLLDLSFIGWAILCLFTFGIGFFVLQPYVQVSHAAFYEDLKAQQGGININVEVTVES